jgi:hypothetical protein
MPMNMRDAIAHYLAYTGGRMPQGGFPGMSTMGGYGIGPDTGGDPGAGPSGGVQIGGPVPADWPVGMPPPPRTPPSPDYTGPQPTQMPTMGGYGVGPDTGGDPGIGPPGGVQMPTMGGYGVGPDTGPMPPQPPVNTPMQAPQIGAGVPAGMDPDQWLRMYRGGAGA